MESLEGKTLDELDNESKYLVHKAKEATNHAYAPYSKFHVGAAVILDDGTVVTGSNQENASFPLCMCAERVVLYTVSSIHPDKAILKMAVVAHKKNHKELIPATACGGCRQVLIEYEERQKQSIKIILLGPAEKWLEFPSASSLMPFSFNKKSLL